MFKFNPNNHVTYQFIRQKLFEPMYFVTSNRYLILVVLACVVSYYIGRNSNVAINDFNVSKTACQEDTLLVRAETIINIFENGSVSKLVFYCNDRTNF